MISWRCVGIFNKKFQFFEKDTGILLLTIFYSRYSKGWVIDVNCYGRDFLEKRNIILSATFIDSDSAINYIEGNLNERK